MTGLFDGKDHPTLWLMRHGETVWNAAGRMQGRLDSPLTGRGREQASEQQNLLTAETLPDDLSLWTSPLGRARETAAIVFSGLGRPVTEDARLTEISVGACEGLTLAEIKAEFPRLFQPDRPWAWHAEAPGGEGEAAFRARVESFLSGLTGPAAIVTHGMTSRMIRGVILGLDWAGMARLPGGQGNIHRVSNRRAEVLAA
ncbi:Phosphoserine phosphatase 1 [Defluviimonas aquaemixtae]|uniref:Phosphoserine phosphatase 1 n=1 Tax=Albidovulum aquaemixtae TaxID=1542388 RepID=A0A2R8B476_9RHOB|nr:histidine phosphatase family protein [Defluviimonas aquaemixtae]SPH17434.1 Phosphoserine phosphatase 1 [Defluviimonas aquaemixtae]